MKFSTSFITGLVTLSLFSPLASAKDTVKLGNTLVPAGFCTQAEDGTVGVRLDGIGYYPWLLAFGIGEDRVNDLVSQANKQRGLTGLPPLSVLEEGQLRAEIRKKARDFQFFYVAQGQRHLCK
jgi:hypothetical protein